MWKLLRKNKLLSENLYLGKICSFKLYGKNLCREFMLYQIPNVIPKLYCKYNV